MNRMTGTGPDRTNASKKQRRGEHHDFQNVSHRERAGLGFSLVGLLGLQNVVQIKSEDAA
jgi:hypothetical protein